MDRIVALSASRWRAICKQLVCGLMSLVLKQESPETYPPPAPRALLQLVTPNRASRE